MLHNGDLRCREAITPACQARIDRTRAETTMRLLPVEDDVMIGESALDLRRVRDDADKRAVITVLSRVNGNIVKAAEILGVSRPPLYDIMHKFGLK